MSPIHPSAPTEATRFPGASVRYSPKKVRFLEPGLPVVGGTLWKKEVAKYATSELNTLVGVSDSSTKASTLTISFELAGPAAFQIGTYKEMSVRLRTTFPSGQTVKSEPVSAKIDNGVEYATAQAFRYAGPLLDITAGVVAMYYFFASAGASLFSNPLGCACLIGLAGTGIALNAAEQGVAYYIATQEERRWSDLFQRALIAHAKDVASAARNPSLMDAQPLSPKSAGSSSTELAPVEEDPLKAPALDDPLAPPILDPAEGDDLRF